MSGVVTAVAGTAIVGGLLSHEAGKKQAKATEQAAEYQAQAAREALAFQKEQYAEIKPYLMQSLQGYQQLLEQPGAYKETPGYMFRLQEGLKAIGIPEGGRYLSGTQIKAATRYAQDYASSEYQNALARIAGLGDLARGVGATGQQYASQAGNILMQGAQARAQGTIGAAEARASGLLGIGRSLAGGAGALAGMYGGMIYNPVNQSTYGGGAGYGQYGNIYQ